MEERIQKIIASRGGISRRAAEELIAQGKVTVNGFTASLGEKADGDIDEICINGRALPKASDKKLYIALNKPMGYVTTMHDEKGRKTVAELVSDLGTRVYPIGRLDLNSEGLLLMTNDGDFANMVAHPSYEKDKVYRVRAAGPLEAGAKRLGEPMELDGEAVMIPKVRIVKMTMEGGVLDITIHEGKNRQIRRMCDIAGLKVLRLTRIAVGPVKLGDLKRGAWRNLTEAEKRALCSK